MHPLLRSHECSKLPQISRLGSKNPRAYGTRCERHVPIGQSWGCKPILDFLRTSAATHDIQGPEHVKYLWHPVWKGRLVFLAGPILFCSVFLGKFHHLSQIPRIWYNVQNIFWWIVKKQLIKHRCYWQCCQHKALLLDGTLSWQIGEQAIVKVVGFRRVNNHLLQNPLATDGTQNDRIRVKPQSQLVMHLEIVVVLLGVSCKSGTISTPPC